VERNIYVVEMGGADESYAAGKVFRAIGRPLWSAGPVAFPSATFALGHLSRCRPHTRHLPVLSTRKYNIRVEKSNKLIRFYGPHLVRQDGTQMSLEIEAIRIDLD
jgi:hypothetical protein